MASDHRTSLRGLARRLGCTHTALSQAFRDGTFSAGVRLDDRGRLVVDDPDAAIREWQTFHAPGRAAPAPPPPPPGVWVDTSWPPMRRAIEDPLVAAHPMALSCLIDSALRDAPDPEAAAAALLARTKIGMPDVDELLAREVASWFELGDEDAGPPGAVT